MKGKRMGEGGGMMLGVLLGLVGLAPTAEAADVRFCAWVTTDFIDNAAGDHWTTAGADKPGRGFKLRVYNTTTATTEWFDWAEESGTYAGCTDELSLSIFNNYAVFVSSQAKIGNVTVEAYDDRVTPDLATATLVAAYSPPAAGERFDAAPLPGDTESLWNYLVLTTMALEREDGGLGTDTLEIYKDATTMHPVYRGYLHAPDGYQRKFILAHELGHYVSLSLSGGVDRDQTAPKQGCNGGAGIIRKEYQSHAAAEAIATFYAATTFNASGYLDDCTFQPANDVDWDLDLDPDTFPTESYVCIGDPWDGVPDPDNEDWLEDLVILDDDDIDMIQCQGTLVNRSTEYDWVRYLWDMRTIEQVPMSGLGTSGWGRRRPHGILTT